MPSQRPDDLGYRTVLEQKVRVAAYFDRISSGYSDRYGDRNPFHSYFFRQRLTAATAPFAFDGKSVLDIGAGTGALYDELIRRCPASTMSPAISQRTCWPKARSRRSEGS